MKITQNRYSPYALIAIIIIIFNLYSIFGIGVPLSDDLVNYNSFMNGNFPWWKLKYHLLSPFRHWIQWSIMYISVYLMKGLLVLLLMIPISWCFFHLFRNVFAFPPWVALVAAVLPNMLPSQWLIPTCINFSSPLFGLFFSILAFIMGFKYLEKPGPKGTKYLFATIVFYLISLNSMEQSLFLLPPMALAFLFYTKLNKKHALLISPLIILALAKYLRMILIPRKAIHNIGGGEMLNRLGLYFKWALPSPEAAPLLLTFFYIGVIAIGFYLLITNDAVKVPKNQNHSHLGPRMYPLFVFSFFLFWSVCTIFVFLFMNSTFESRYTYISAFGICGVTVFSIYLILRQITIKKIKIWPGFLIILLLFSGVSRYKSLKKQLGYRENIRNLISSTLKQKYLPKHSQIVVAGVWGASLGWYRSSGYLKYLLRRKDITGIVGPANPGKYHYNFMDHFNPRERGWSQGYPGMTGLSIKKPTFFFMVNQRKLTIKPVDYILQWYGRTRDSRWTMFRTNNTTGDLIPMESGKGMAEYMVKIEELKKKGISQREILWGGPPTDIEKGRLGISD